MMNGNILGVVDNILEVVPSVYNDIVEKLKGLRCLICNTLAEDMHLRWHELYFMLAVPVFMNRDQPWKIEVVSIFQKGVDECVIYR